MSSISELEHYCNIDNPVGALLLTGEWGCGKTYIIEHDLQENLKDKCVIIRVSLFGISRVEELHKSVKDAWIHARGGLLDKASGLDKIKSFIEKLTKLIPNDVAKEAIEGALSFNLFDLIKIENKIDCKKVILVFDDLERSKLSIQEKLGAINEYCENQHFNVIIVADEDKINSLAKKFIGYTPSNIVGIVKEASRQAFIHDKEIDSDDILNALNESNFEKIKEEEYMPENKRPAKKLGFGAN